MPFNSEISVKRKHGILIIVMNYYFDVRETCVRPDPPPPPPPPATFIPIICLHVEDQANIVPKKMN